MVQQDFGLMQEPLVRTDLSRMCDLREFVALTLIFWQFIHFSISVSLTPTAASGSSCRSLSTISHCRNGCVGYNVPLSNISVIVTPPWPLPLWLMNPFALERSQTIPSPMSVCHSTELLLWHSVDKLNYWYVPGNCFRSCHTTTDTASLSFLLFHSLGTFLWMKLAYSQSRIYVWLFQGLLLC